MEKVTRLTGEVLVMLAVIGLAYAGGSILLRADGFRICLVRQ